MNHQFSYDTFKTTELTLNKLMQSGMTSCYLYKYKPDNIYTREIISKNILWFAQPSEFNDVYDCRANSQYEDNDLEQWFSQQAHISGRKSKRLLKNAKNKQLRRNIQNDINAVLDKIGVLSLSKTPLDILMWAYYADSSKGVCFEFDISKDPKFFFSALPVVYSENTPIYNHFKASKNVVRNVILTKAKCWEHEKEIRVLKSGDEIINNKSRAFKFIPNALTKIIFGPKTSHDIIIEYKNLCKEREDMHHVRFTKIIMQNDKYAFLEQDV